MLISVFSLKIALTIGCLDLILKVKLLCLFQMNVVSSQIAA